MAGAGGLARAPVVPVSQQVAGNWSGYAITGGSFSAVSGTFTVPSLAAATTCVEDVSEWVGLGGYYSSQLLQAGVLETRVDPNTGQCTRGTAWVVPWTEALPAKAVVAGGLAVRTSDSVTVNISEQTTSHWQASITDNTTGQSYLTTINYDDPARSAEWVVEAPGAIGSSSLAPYVPAVNFYDLSVNDGRAVTGAIRIVMEQEGTLCSVPSQVHSLAQLASEGFSVTDALLGPLRPHERLIAGVATHSRGQEPAQPLGSGLAAAKRPK